MNSPPLRREIQKGRTLEEMEFHWIDPESDRKLQAGMDESAGDKKRASPASSAAGEALEEIKAAPCACRVGGGRPLLHVHHALSGEHGGGAVLREQAALSKVPAEWVQELVRRLPELDRRGLTFLSRPGRAGDWGTGPGAVHHPDGPPAVPVLPAGGGAADGPLRPPTLPCARRTSPLWRSLRGDLPGLRAAGAAGVGRGGI